MTSIMNKKIEPVLNLAIKYLSYQPRTVHEIRKHIQKKGFDDDIVKKIIEILLEKKYLDDNNYAQLFIQGRVRNKPKSKFAFRYELKKKGVSSLVIDKILEQYDDQTLAIKSVKPKIRLWQNFDDKKFKKKMMNYLRYRGFNYDICLATLDYFCESNNLIKEDFDEN
ncbi:MAG: regulatory protein RecX [Deltaproteobacteria bacterium]|nr:MAG: regulatory protein RecX [Deltaproteobacteria bacterium]